YFPGEVSQCTLKGAYTVRHVRSLWNQGSTELDLADADVLFVFGQYADVKSSTLHVNVKQQAAALMAKGVLIVAFINNANSFHIQNLLNIPPGVFLTDAVADPARCLVETSTPFDAIFSQFGNLISAAKSLGILQSSSDYAGAPLLRHVGNAVIGYLVKKS